MVAAFPAPSENAVLVASHALLEPDESGLDPLGRLDPHSDDTEIHDADDVVSPLMAAACHNAQRAGTLRPTGMPSDPPIFFVFVGHYAILLTMPGTAVMAILYNIYLIPKNGTGVKKIHLSLFSSSSMLFSAYARGRAVVRALKSLLLREDRICPWWFAYTFDNPLRRFLHNSATLLAPHVREGMIVADIGCGMGYFSIALAALVGDAGKVIAVDVQQEMLDRTRKRAERAGVARRIRPVLAAHDDLGFREPVDFVLVFWMAHETEDIRRFFNQVFSILKEQGKMLIAEPKMHVGRRRFLEIVQAACDAGFRYSGAPSVRLSRAALMERN